MPMLIFIVEPIPVAFFPQGNGSLFKVDGIADVSSTDYIGTFRLVFSSAGTERPSLVKQPVHRLIRVG